MHHILPKSLFEKFEDLGIYKWNGVYLEHYHHAFAHGILTEAINSSKMNFAFYNMTNEFVVNDDINKNDFNMVYIKIIFV